MSQIIADHAKLRPLWVANRASRATSGRIVRYRRTQGGRMVHTALHVAHCMRQMVRRPSGPDIMGVARQAPAAATTWACV